MDEILERIKKDRFVQITLVILVLVIIGVLWFINNLFFKSSKRELPCYNQRITILSPFYQNELTSLVREAQAYCINLNFEIKSLDYIKENLLKDIARGDIPDIVFVDSDFLKENQGIFKEYNGKKINFDEYPENILKPLNNKYLAYPLYFDTLVTFANRDYLNNAGIIELPTTFEELQNKINSLRIFDENKNIKIAAMALGTAYNIDRLFEIFVTIHRNLNEERYKELNSFYNTLDFYTQFSNKLSPYFTWEEYLPSSFTAFAQGQVALVFGLYSDKEKISKINERIKVEVYPFPKFARSINKYNFIKTYFFAVPKQGNYKYAWMVLEFFDKYYSDFIKQKGYLPVKKKIIENIDKEKGRIAKDLLIGHYFREFNKDYFENAIKKDINNWLSDKDYVRRLISVEQFNKFFVK